MVEITSQSQQSHILSSSTEREHLNLQLKDAAWSQLLFHIYHRRSHFLCISLNFLQEHCQVLGQMTQPSQHQVTKWARCKKTRTWHPPENWNLQPDATCYKHEPQNSRLHRLPEVMWICELTIKSIHCEESIEVPITEIHVPEMLGTLKRWRKC